ncbi:MAG: hypothetical protein FE834_03870 [Gammaproteobacteria bacterium]|nr:hypothetical protein [Gammaproteobacteria bacterium]
MPRITKYTAMQAVTQQPVGNKSIFAIIQSIIDNCNGITLVKINNRIKITPHVSQYYGYFFGIFD